MQLENETKHKREIQDINFQWNIIVYNTYLIIYILKDNIIKSKIIFGMFFS